MPVSVSANAPLSVSFREVNMTKISVAALLVAGLVVGVAPNTFARGGRLLQGAQKCETQTQSAQSDPECIALKKQEADKQRATAPADTTKSDHPVGNK